jgi:lipid-A-disaccharide synthase
MTTYDLFISAAEASGDLHGEALLQSLDTLSPSLKTFGVGGPRMRALPLKNSNFKTLLPMEEFQVMGFVDVFLALPRLRRHFYFLADAILKENPKAALFIDYPGFHLRLEKHLKKRGFQGKIIHYISPSVWAHGSHRISFLEKNTDLLLCIFPFEPPLFTPSFQAEYVGHPLVSRLEEPPLPLSWTQGKRIISLFPGSRKKEILLNLPTQLKALKSVLSPDTLGAISLSQEAFLPLIVKCLEKEGLSLSHDSIRLVPSEDTYALMKGSHCALAKSGTVTLELALLGIPTLVTYGIAPLDLFIAKRILRISLPFYCIVNIIAKEEIFPEYIGPSLTPQALTSALQTLLASYEEKKALTQKIPILLGKKKASLEAARLILDKIH